MRIPFGSVASLALCFTVSAFAAEPFDDKFRQLEEVLPTPNTYRTASGAPGHAYWQQRADYTIRATLDEAKREIAGSGSISYHNQSPDTLGYLWLQLDQNIYKPDSDARRMTTAPSRQAWARTAGDETMKFEGLRGILARGDFQGGFHIRALKGADGQALKYVVNRTMMRIDLPQPLKPGQDFVFQIEWDYRINEQKVLGGRAGYEVFDDKNALFEVAQWFPRMAAYYDAAGWQHKQFLGSGEFTLEFGDYDVQLTVPADHIVAATGALQNPQDVLSSAQRERLEQARGSDKPVIIVTQKEAALQGGQRARLRLGIEPQVHLGCARLQEGRQRCDGHVLLSERRQSAVGKIQHASHRAHDRAVQQVQHRLPVPDGHFRQRPRGRHGVSDDLVQRPPSGERQKDGRADVFEADQVWADRRHHPRSGPQLLPDDHQLGRAPVDLDGRRPQHLRAVPGAAGLGRELPGLARRTARDRRLHA